MGPFKGGTGKKKRKKKPHNQSDDDEWSDIDVNQSIANMSGMEVDGSAPNGGSLVQNFTKKKKTEGESKLTELVSKANKSSAPMRKIDSNVNNALSENSGSLDSGGSADLHNADQPLDGKDSSSHGSAVVIKVNTSNKTENSGNGEGSQTPSDKSLNTPIHGDTSGNPGGPPTSPTPYIKPPIPGADLSLDDPSARFVHMICTNGKVPNDCKHLNPWDVDTELQALIGTYVSRKTLKSGIFLIECESYTQVIRLLEQDCFLGLPIRVNVAYNIGTTRGVVKDSRASQMEDDVLLDRLKSQSVVQVRPIFVGSGENKRRSDFTILVFRLDVLPKTVNFGGEPKDVVPYKQKIYQCVRCWNYGHHQDQCEKFKSCEKCATKGDTHDSSSCSVLPLKCSLCYKDHKATDRLKCDRYKKERAILNIREEQRVGYKVAEEIYLRLNKNKPNQFRSTSRKNTDTANANSTAKNHPLTSSVPNSKGGKCVPKSTSSITKSIDHSATSLDYDSERITRIDTYEYPKNFEEAASSFLRFIKSPRQQPGCSGGISDDTAAAVAEGGVSEEPMELDPKEPVPSLGVKYRDAVLSPRRQPGGSGGINSDSVAVVAADDVSDVPLNLIKYVSHTPKRHPKRDLASSTPVVADLTPVSPVIPRRVPGMRGGTSGDLTERGSDDSSPDIVLLRQGLKPQTAIIQSNSNGSISKFKDVGVQTVDVADKSVQTCFSHEKDNIGYFIKEIIKVVDLEEGNITWHCRPMANLLNNCFNIDVDPKWCLDVLR